MEEGIIDCILAEVHGDGQLTNERRTNRMELDVIEKNLISVLIRRSAVFT